MGDLPVLVGHRHRSPTKRPLWIIILVCMIIVFLVCAYTFSQQSIASCYIFPWKGCPAISDWIPPVPTREYTDEEIASHVVIHDILNSAPPECKNPKIAFLFLSPGLLPFEKLWHAFFQKQLLHFYVPDDEELPHDVTDIKVLNLMSVAWGQLSCKRQGHEGRFSIYVHSSKEKSFHVSHYFVNREVQSDQMGWGKDSMIDAKRRLLARALEDPDNLHFVLLSDSCVPLRTFDYVYDYLIHTSISYVDCFYDPGPHGNGRYSKHMLPEVEKQDFRKGGQWFTLKRQHAVVVLADSLYFSKFRDYCKPGLEGQNCIADEHYLPTFLSMVDPGGISNWSVTHVDWSERKWYPKAYRAHDVTFGLLKKIMSVDVSIHVTSDPKHEEQRRPCLWNGVKRPCYLFARKFYPETLDKLLHVFSNYSSH